MLLGKTAQDISVEERRFGGFSLLSLQRASKVGDGRLGITPGVVYVGFGMLVMRLMAALPRAFFITASRRSPPRPSSCICGCGMYTGVSSPSAFRCASSFSRISRSSMAEGMPLTANGDVIFPIRGKSSEEGPKGRRKAGFWVRAVARVPESRREMNVDASEEGELESALRMIAREPPARWWALGMLGGKVCRFGGREARLWVCIYGCMFMSVGVFFGRVGS